MAKKTEVEIDFRKSAQENAQCYFDEAKWAKEKMEATKAALARTRRDIAKLSKESMKRREEKKAPVKRRRGKWFEKFRWMRTSDGYLVVAGRDATQNEVLFKKHLEPGDIVLHADITGAPFTIVKSEGREVSPLAIREAGEFAAAYSSAWKAGLGGVDVYWAKPEDVSKTPKAGEFLPKGAFIFHKRNFMKKMELKVSIGVMIEKDKEGNRVAKAVAGSVQALNKNADYFVTIRPGAVQQPQLAAEIKRKILIKSMPEDTALIEQIPIEDFQRLIPSGGGFIFGG